ncbi:exopolysaccharide transport family protein [Rhizobium sp. CECT 9324]|uniref:GumC family protein n=1 Tax=Rhizobium sp. CECT 9324 TaxID=2845820 RepID=UPI001E4DF5C3|nr:exopolysaccharide transport family protein [Rhizobium sp. CECT 9324]CAH0342896.1 Tyrosine-protein kinase ptk [Rhizobium sp. CECT 9324]
MGLHEFATIETYPPIEGRGEKREEYTSIRDVFNFLVKNIRVIVFAMLAGLCLGILYILNTTSSYEATTRLVIDPEQGRIVSQDVSTGTVIIEAAEIASQVEIVKSEAIAEDVIRNLSLIGDPEIVDDRSWKSTLRGLLTSALEVATGSRDVDQGPPSDEERMRRTMDGFLSRVSVRRVGQSYVLEIGYRSGDAEKAARTANALAEAYIRNGMNDRAAAAKQGAQWLEGQLIDVGRKAREAALAAEEYRNDHDITAMSDATSLDQQQLAEVSSQMLAARAATADASAKLTTLSELIAKNSTDASLPEVADNPQIQKLRDDIRLAQTRLESLKDRYSIGNPAITTAEADIARIQAAIAVELRQVEGLYRSNLEIAKTREALAEQQFSAANSQGADKNIARVELAEIESRANTYRRIYESILQQFVGTFQTQSFPIGKARIVAAATEPFSRNWPKPAVIVPFSLVIGLAFGLLVAVLRSALDRRAGTSERLQRELGITSLGHVPVYKPQRSGKDHGSGLPASLSPLRSILDMPYCPFSEALRGVKHSLDSMVQTNGSMVIGITSVGSGEGKTTIATNLAQLYQNEGQSVLLVDADFVAARLTRLAVNAASKLALKPIHPAALGDPVVGPNGSRLRSSQFGPPPYLEQNEDDETADTAIPVPLLTVEQTRRSAATPYRYGHLSALKDALAKLRRQYKVIIVDMSGFEDSADTRAICSYVDGIILVIGNTKKLTIERLSDALKAFGRSRIALLGVISNRSGTKPHRNTTLFGGLSQ